MEGFTSISHWCFKRNASFISSCKFLMLMPPASLGLLICSHEMTYLFLLPSFSLQINFHCSLSISLTTSFGSLSCCIGQSVIELATDLTCVIRPTNDKLDAHNPLSFFVILSTTVLYLSFLLFGWDIFAPKYLPNCSTCLNLGAYCSSHCRLDIG